MCFCNWHVIELYVHVAYLSRIRILTVCHIRTIQSVVEGLDSMGTVPYMVDIQAIQVIYLYYSIYCKYTISCYKAPGRSSNAILVSNNVMDGFMS